MIMKLTYIGESISYDVDIAAIKTNVIQALGSNLIAKETGFMLTDDAGNEYDYSAYSTLYRTVDGGFQFSNDGEVWVEPTKNVIVNIIWMDDDNILKLRPSSVKVNVFDNEQSIGTVTLNDKNNWTKIYENVPVSHEYTVTAGNINQYERIISGTTITYAIDQPYEPTIEEQLEELTDFVTELDERVYALEES